MSRLLELINQDVIETIQSHTLFCICCLKRNVDFINITTCSHSDYLYNFTRPELKPINEVICHTCHRILKKIKQFKLQVMQSFNLLTTQALNMETADKVKPSFGFVKVVDINIPSENPNPREADSNAIVPPDKATEPTLAKPVNKKQKKNKKEALNIIDDNASVKLFAAVEMEEAAITEYMETIVVKEEASVMDPLACSGKTATPELPAIVKIEGNPMMEEETQVPEVVIENAVTGVISRIAGTDAVVCSDPGRAKDDMPKLTAGFARIIKLAVKRFEEHMDTNKSTDYDIMTMVDENEDPGNGEYPLPCGSQSNLIKLNEILGDVFYEDDDEPENNEPFATTSNCFKIPPKINVDDNITLNTPMPSPTLQENSNDAFCTTYSEIENPPILTNEELCRNSPTPSVTPFSSVHTPTSTKIKQTRQSFKSDKGKKRLLHKENWMTNKRKTLKNQGKSFINYRGKEIQEKKLKEPCNEKCRMKCFSKFSESQRKTIFKRFWDLGDRRNQWQFVIKYMQKVPKRRKTIEVLKHDRRNTFYYFLPTEDKGKVKVCKTMFLNTISAGERIVSTSWKKYDGEMLVAADKRGKYIHKHSVIDEDMIKSVCDHVKSFPLVKSHGIRKDSTKLYLEGVRSASHMFDLYCKWFDSGKYRNKACKIRQYRDILNANFNIGFHKPTKDL